MCHRNNNNNDSNCIELQSIEISCCTWMLGIKLKLQCDTKVMEEKRATHTQIRIQKSSCIISRNENCITNRLCGNTHRYFFRRTVPFSTRHFELQNHNWWFNVNFASRWSKKNLYIYRDRERNKLLRNLSYFIRYKCIIDHINKLVRYSFFLPLNAFKLSVESNRLV